MPNMATLDIDKQFSVSGFGPNLKFCFQRLAICESYESRYKQDFKELCLIGSGSFGSVYKCTNRMEGCIYALKRSHHPVSGATESVLTTNAVSWYFYFGLDIELLPSEKCVLMQFLALTLTLSDTTQHGQRITICSYRMNIVMVGMLSSVWMEKVTCWLACSCRWESVTAGQCQQVRGKDVWGGGTQANPKACIISE